MAPLLIDGRDLIKYGFITVLASVFIFAGGVFYGYQSAASFYLAGSDSEPLLLPIKAALADQVREPTIPEKIVAGEHIDVDQPDAASAREHTAVIKAGSDESEITKQAMMEKEQDIVVAKTKAGQAAEGGNEPARPEVTPAQTSQAGTGMDQRENIESIDVSALSADELDSIKYSIQVGMYGSLANAENMVKRLQANEFDAYVSGFTNKKNETRYNVRFGYFLDKQAAKSALKQYRQSQQADGYLVKFKLDSMMKQGMTSMVKNSQSAGSERDVTEAEPVSAELKTTDDKLSRADNLNIENVIKSHGKASETITATN